MYSWFLGTDIFKVWFSGHSVWRSRGSLNVSFLSSGSVLCTARNSGCLFVPSAWKQAVYLNQFCFWHLLNLWSFRPIWEHLCKQEGFWCHVCNLLWRTVVYCLPTYHVTQLTLSWIGIAENLSFGFNVLWEDVIIFVEPEQMGKLDFLIYILQIQI